MLPRFEWTGTQAGSICSAFRQAASAASRSPRCPRIVARLLTAAADLGSISIARRQMPLGFLEPPHHPQDVPEVVQCRGQVRLQAQCRSQAFLGGIEVAAFLQHAAEIVQGIRVVGTDRKRLPYRFFRLVQVPLPLYRAPQGCSRRRQIGD